MAYRFRALMRFTENSGLAAWAKAQNDVRLGQSYHMNEGALNQELSGHDTEGETYKADFFFADSDEALANDTYATMTDASVLSWLKPGTEEEKSFVEVHHCFHDAVPVQPCDVTQKWTQEA